MRTAVMFVAISAVVLFAPRAGNSACAPDDRAAMPPLPQPGGTVVCSGSDPDGFSRGFVDGLSVRVTSGANIGGIIVSNASGASVTVAPGSRVRSPGAPKSAITLGDVVGGSISNAGQADSSAFGIPAIFGFGSNLTIDNSGVVQTQGNEAAGIDLLSAFHANISNSGQILTSGAEANGIDAFGSAIFVDNTGTIQTTGLEARGVFLEGFDATPSLISVLNAGGITTGGNEAQGVFVEAFEATVANDGSVTTSGFASPGILIDGIGAVIENRSQVTTSGTLSPGLGALQGGGNLKNSGTIRTTGSDAAGLQVGIAFLGVGEPSDTNTLLNTGMIDVSGADAHGLFAVGTGNTLTNGPVGSVVASGSGSAGIQVGVSTPGLAVSANANTLLNVGTITSAGANGHGLHAAGSNNALTNEGTIRVDGSGGDGLGASGDTNTLTNESGGQILVRSGAKGMNYAGDSGFAINLGLIEASATDADGISMLGDSLTASNSGSIEVTGGGTGISVTGDAARANNQSLGVITTTAASSAGIWLLEGGRIQNLGQVQTFGSDASGLVVSGTTGREVRVTSDGSVSTIGSGAHGIEVGRDAPAASGRVSLTGAIATAGANADGVHVDAQAYDVRIGATGGISTSGADADGVMLTGGGNTLDSAGTIQAQGAGSAGVRLETTGGLQVFFNSGSVTSSGDAVVGSGGGEAIFQSGTGTITGDIRLEGGSDFLTISEGSVFTGLADGGSGANDELEVETLSIDTLAGSQFVNFEAFRKTGSGLLGVQGVLGVDLALVEQGQLAIQPGSTLQATVGVSVASGASLVGSGTVAGDIVVDPGGFLAPGLSVGTLEVSGDITLGGMLEIEVSGPSLGDSDLVRILGEADLGSGQILLKFIDNYAPMVGDAFFFLEAGSLLGFDQVGLGYSGLPSGYAFSLSAGTSGLVATTTAVPEPSGTALLLIGASLLVAHGRSRRARADTGGRVG
jgi:hypothetical protein